MANFCQICLDTTSVYKCDHCGGTFCGHHHSPCRPNGWHGFVAACAALGLLLMVIVSPLFAGNDYSETLDAFAAHEDYVEKRCKTDHVFCENEKLWEEYKECHNSGADHCDEIKAKIKLGHDR